MAAIDEDIQQFISWLDSNGAKYNRIKWPTYETPSGMRGAVAITNIETNEFILEIPISLMITPVNALNDPEIGKELETSKEILRGDLLLTVFFMHEKLKGTRSFWYPYIKILPVPDTITNWTDSQLAELQSSYLVSKVGARRNLHKNMYERSMVALSKKYPEKFPLEQFTFELFSFAWNTISARAFGRRLPWSALVPLADCLNHSNKQTKYDFNAQENGSFRLFPTGTNRYDAGMEVCNSYGRRNNENLMLDYGFALLDNEWDFCEISISLQQLSKYEEFVGRKSDEAVLPADRLRVLLSLGFANVFNYGITWTDIPWKAFPFVRTLVLNHAEYNYFMTYEADNKTTTRTMADYYLNEDNDEDGEDTMLATPGILSKSSSKSHILKPMFDPISIRNEVHTLQLLLSILRHTAETGWPSSLTHDQLLLDDLQAKGRRLIAVLEYDVYWLLAYQAMSLMVLDGAPQILQHPYEFEEGQDVWKLIAAVTYRLTKKHLLAQLIAKIEILYDALMQINAIITAAGALADDDVLDERKEAILQSMYQKMTAAPDTSNMSHDSSKDVVSTMPNTWDLEKYMSALRNPSLTVEVPFVPYSNVHSGANTPSSSKKVDDKVDNTRNVSFANAVVQIDEEDTAIAFK